MSMASRHVENRNPNIQEYDSGLGVPFSNTYELEDHLRTLTEKQGQEFQNEHSDTIAELNELQSANAEDQAMQREVERQLAKKD